MKTQYDENNNWVRPQFYTVREAAVALNVSDKTVRRLLLREVLHSSKALRKKLIPRKDIETFFEATK